MKKLSEIEVHPWTIVLLPTALFFGGFYLGCSGNLLQALFMTLIIGGPCVLIVSFMYLPHLVAGTRGLKDFKARKSGNSEFHAVMDWVLNLRDALSGRVKDPHRIAITNSDNELR